MPQGTLLLASLCLAQLFHGAAAFYFVFQEGHRKCFIEDMPESTLMVGHYQSLDFDSLGTRKVTVSVLNPQGRQIAYQTLEKEGRIAFTSEKEGNHRICIVVGKVSNRGTGAEFRLELGFDTGEYGQDWDRFARQEHLSSIEIEINRLVDRVYSIRIAQAYMKKREEEWRGMSEATNTRVTWWSLAQLILLIGSA